MTRSANKLLVKAALHEWISFSLSSSLQSFLASIDWHHCFDEHVLVLGKKLAKKPLLPDLALNDVGDGTLQLTATCEGEEVEVDLWPEGEGHWDFDALCSCDHSHHCPHAAAAMFLAGKPNTFSRLIREAKNPNPDPDSNPTPYSPPEEESTSQSDSEPAPSSTSSASAMGGKPTFHLHLTPEPVASKVTRLLMQALRTPNHETWLVAKPTIQYGEFTIPLSPLPQQHSFPRDPALERRALEQLTAPFFQNLITLRPTSIGHGSAPMPFLS